MSVKIWKAVWKNVIKLSIYMAPWPSNSLLGYELVGKRHQEKWAIRVWFMLCYGNIRQRLEETDHMRCNNWKVDPFHNCLPSKNNEKQGLILGQCHLCKLNWYAHKMTYILQLMTDIARIRILAQRWDRGMPKENETQGNELINEWINGHTYTGGDLAWIYEISMLWTENLMFLRLKNLLKISQRLM